MKPWFLALLAVTNVIAVNNYWGESDTKTTGDYFQSVLSSKKDDLAALHYAASGLKLLKVTPNAASAKHACELAKKVNVKSLDSLFHASALSGDLPDCAFSSLAGIKETIDAAISGSSTAEKILKAVAVADRLAIKIDQAAVDAALTAVLKEGSVGTLVYGVTAAAYLDKARASKHFPSINALINQGSIVDKSYIQFDGPIHMTADAVHAILALAAKAGKAPTFSKDYVSLLANRLVANKHVRTPQSAFSVVRALGDLVNNEYTVPVAVTVHGPSSVDIGKKAQIHISNVFGLPIVATAVKADLTSAAGNVNGVVLTKSDSKGLIFDLPLNQVKSGGVYKVAITVESNDKKLVGLAGHTVQIAVVEEVVVENFQLDVLGKDDAIPEKAKQVATFSKHGSVVSVEHLKRLYFSFDLKTKADGRPVQAHQTFIRFVHASGVDVPFVVKSEGNGKYSLDVNLNLKTLKEFEGASGKYSAHLLVGDASIKTPINWVFADYSFNLPPTPVEIVPESERISYEPLPKIDHLFRQPDKRAPAVVSSFFTLACLAPLALLVIMWLVVGFNFGNMPATPWALLFHVGLAGIFALYGIFWLQLNMFETVKYLGIVGTFTFIALNRLLKTLAANSRKEKAE